MLVVPTPLLGHAGGFSWDEALLVMAPIVVLGLLLWLANRRARRLGDGGQPDGGQPDDVPAGNADREA